MVAITGASGMIGGCLARKLAEKTPIAIFDRWYGMKNRKCWGSIPSYDYRLNADSIFAWLSEKHDEVSCVVHLGAITDTTATDEEEVYRNNVSYSKALFILCEHYNIPFIYASSASVYGDGTDGFDDSISADIFSPLNLYARSKYDFDKFMMKNASDSKWYGLRFSNVYGPYESHKGKMASMIYQGYKQIVETGKIKLFKSYKNEFSDGEQKRDFIYVYDIVNVIEWLMENLPTPGIYNLGTGAERSYNEMANIIFSVLEKKPKIKYMDMPDDIKDKYQYFTKVSPDKLMKEGCNVKFHTLEEGVSKYVKLLEYEEHLQV